LAETRIQLCGAVHAVMDGNAVHDRLPGRQGRLLFAYLVEARTRPVGRAELVDALWPKTPPEAAEAGLSALLSKLRRAIGAERIEGRGAVQLRLPPDAWIDVEAAADALHRAESAVARDAWTEAWGPARVVQHIARRPFLAGEESSWVEAERARLDEVYLRSLELVSEACLSIGGTELDTAERAARTLVERAPYRETGYRELMRTLVARENPAEALRVYEGLRARLREELGATPSESTQALYRELLARG
jgi:DNA-binding SARP family transcriptional activator